MAEIRHLIPPETVAKLKEMAPILGDPMTFHKTKFIAYLEHQADYLYEILVKAGVSHENALIQTQEKLKDMTKEWKAAAKAKATR